MNLIEVTPPFGRLFGARDAATYLGITVSKARKLIARGELIAVRTDRGRLEGVYERDLDDWIARHRRAVATPKPKAIAVDERVKALMPAERVFG